jgi:hypothetical protein
MAASTMIPVIRLIWLMFIFFLLNVWASAFLRALYG